MSSINNSFQVRPASAEDLDGLCKLAEQFLNQIRADGTAQDSRRVLERTLKAPSAGIVIVAEHRSGLCGYGYAEYQWRSEFGGETMDLVEMFVEQPWRNKGVAGTMMGALIKNARQRGIHRVTAQVHPGNAVIEHTLESNGFDPERRTLWGIRI